MIQPVDGTTILLITCTGLSIAAAVYLAVRALVNAILSPDGVDTDQWHREHARWQRLREKSGLFRSGELWIVGVSRVVQTRLSWLVEPMDTTIHRWRKATDVCIRVVFGSPQRLQEAVQIRCNEQPWSAPEVVATSIWVGGYLAVAVMMFSLGSLPSWQILGVGIASWLLGFRFFRWRFCARAATRRQAVRQFLPHAMDMIAMVISSGDPFRSGVDTVIRDFPAHPLSQELRRLRNNLDRGQTMLAALETAALSICLPEFDELVRVLGRVQEHGVPAAENFTRMAKQLRSLQLRYMEEAVGRAEASMAMPTMLVMLACMIVSAAPFILSIMQSDLFNL